MSPNRIFSFSIVVTLKIRSKSQKSNQFFVMSQLYIHESLKESNLAITGSQDIVQTRECHANADVNGIRIQKQYVLLPLGGGT